MSLVDLTNVSVSNEFDPLPAGKYSVVCESAAVKETKAGTGEYINVKFSVTDGDHKDRKVFTMYNLKNPNPKAVEIGLGQLKRFMEAAGEDNLNLSRASDLEGLRCDVKLSIKTDSYGDKNNITSYKEFSGELVAQVTGSNVTADDIPF